MPLPYFLRGEEAKGKFVCYLPRSCSTSMLQLLKHKRHTCPDEGQSVPKNLFSELKSPIMAKVARRKKARASPRSPVFIWVLARFSLKKLWCAVQESNLRPLAPEANALSN